MCAPHSATGVHGDSAAAIAIDFCLKIAVLVTDARPGGADDTYVDGVDDVNAAAVAAIAAAAGVKISAVLVAAIEAIIAACGSSDACPLSQGFYETHGTEWPLTSLVLGTQTYSAAELLAILTKPTKGDASLTLAKQLIAAKLDVAGGSPSAPVSAAIADADAELGAFSGKLPYGVKPSSAAGHAMTATADVLDDYDNRALTPECR